MLSERRMFSSNPAKQLPNLSRYVEYASRKPRRHPRESWAAVMAGIGLAILGAGLVTNALLAIGASLPLIAGAGFLWLKREKGPKDVLSAKRADALQTAQVLKQMLDQRRIHRDLDEGSLALLEESARCWVRVQTALGAEYWQDLDLPITYMAARDQARGAADEAMMDILLLYGQTLPQTVGARPAMDYVDEALEKFVFKSRNDRMPPPEYYTARQVADKMLVLAQEAERIAREGVPALATPPGHSLDVALGELRQIRQAEEELQNDLRA